MNDFDQIHSGTCLKAEQNTYMGSHLLRPTKTRDGKLTLPLIPWWGRASCQVGSVGYWQLSRKPQRSDGQWSSSVVVVTLYKVCSGTQHHISLRGGGVRALGTLHSTLQEFWIPHGNGKTILRWIGLNCLPPTICRLSTWSGQIERNGGREGGRP